MDSAGAGQQGVGTCPANSTHVSAYNIKNSLLKARTFWGKVCAGGGGEEGKGRGSIRKALLGEGFASGDGVFYREFWG